MLKNIYDIPAYYISFKPSETLENHIKNRGFKNINHFQAIDGRKFDLDDLLDNNKITIRGYNDITFGRTEHAGLPSLGAIGCTMSHSALWQKCIDDGLSYILILEDDVEINNLSQTDIQKILNILKQPNSIFVGSYINKDTNENISFIGLQFYIISQGACKEAIKYAFPVDIQTDWYLAHLNNKNKINLNGFPMSDQKSHASSIQDGCLKCMLPNDNKFYKITIIMGIFLSISIIVIIYLLSRGFYKCRKNLKHCKNTCSVPPTKK